MANRSGEDDGNSPDKPDPEGFDESIPIRHSERPIENSEINEFTVHLKLGYKTLLLVIVVLDILHISIRELLDTNFIEQLLGE